MSNIAPKSEGSLEANHDTTRYNRRWICGTQPLSSLGACEPFTLHAAAITHHEHRQCGLADVGAGICCFISGMLNLSRNLGLITGASVMGAVFAVASATADIMTAHPEAVATGMRITFAVAAMLIIVALAIAVGSRADSRSAPSTT